MHIKHHGCKIDIDQYTYLNKIIECFELQNTNFTLTSLPQEYYPIHNNGPVNLALYIKFQTIIGSLLYIMISTQPDIAYAIMALSKHLANPIKEHVSKATYICCYLLGTPDAMLYSIVIRIKALLPSPMQIGHLIPITASPKPVGSSN